MDRMWSPWRAEYVSKATDRPPPEGTSIFSALENEENDEENLILWRGDQVFVIMNRYPYNNGHLLIVPYRQVEHYEALDPSEQQAIAVTVERCIRWLREALSPDGFNVGLNLGSAAGAGIPQHLHVHVVPRWESDTNFMSSTGETRVLPEDLSSTYQKLRSAVQAESSSSDQPS